MVTGTKSRNEIQESKNCIFTITHKCNIKTGEISKSNIEEHISHLE